MLRPGHLFLDVNHGRGRVYTRWDGRDFACDVYKKAGMPATCTIPVDESMHDGSAKCPVTKVVSTRTHTEVYMSATILDIGNSRTLCRTALHPCA